MQLKIGMTNAMLSATMSQRPTKENVAFQRYADKVLDPAIEEGMQVPRGQPFKRIDASKELFRVQKTSDHWEQLRRSKQFLADDFFPPRSVPLDANLQTLYNDELASNEAAFEERLCEIIPNLNHD